MVSSTWENNSKGFYKDPPESTPRCLVSKRSISRFLFKPRPPPNPILSKFRITTCKTRLLLLLAVFENRANSLTCKKIHLCSCSKLRNRLLVNSNSTCHRPHAPCKSIKRSDPEFMSSESLAASNSDLTRIKKVRKSRNRASQFVDPVGVGL